MDIVERLRISAGCTEMDDPIKWGAGSSDVMRAAAVEIDRLRGDCQGFKSAYDQACKDLWNLTEKVIPNLRDENAKLRAAYRKMCNAAAGYSNYCEDSASVRRCEREYEEAEAMYRAIK